MTITRKAFLGSTTAYTVARLYGAPSSPPEAVDRPRWASIWFDPPARTSAAPSGPGMTINLTAFDRDRLRRARPGQGLKGEQTTHYVQDAPPEFNPLTGEGLDPALRRG